VAVSLRVPHKRAPGLCRRRAQADAEVRVQHEDARGLWNRRAQVVGCTLPRERSVQRVADHRCQRAHERDLTGSEWLCRIAAVDLERGDPPARVREARVQGPAHRAAQLVEQPKVVARLDLAEQPPRVAPARLLAVVERNGVETSAHQRRQLQIHEGFRCQIDLAEPFAPRPAVTVRRRQNPVDEQRARIDGEEPAVVEGDGPLQRAEQPCPERLRRQAARGEVRDQPSGLCLGTREAGHGCCIRRPRDRSTKPRIPVG